MAPIARKRNLSNRPWTTSGYPEAAAVSTSLTGTNNDITYTADAKAASGNNVTVTYVVSGNNTPLSVSVTGSAITVNVATDGSGNPTSTAAQVITAINGSAPASALVNVANAAGNNGSGVVTAMASTPLTGGRSQTIGSGRRGWGSKRVTKRSDIY